MTAGAAFEPVGVPAGTPAGSLPAALAEPVAPVTRGWVARLTIASIGLWSGFFGPIQVLLALQAEAIAPAHKEAVLGLVTAVGAAVAVVANPVAGALSDRTTSRFGRRLPWVAGGAAAGALALLGLGQVRTVVLLVLGWAVGQAALNAMLAALTAAVPDHVPVAQRGAVSGWVGSAQMLGVLGGTGLATAAGGIGTGYLLLSVLLVVTAVPYLARARDPVLPASYRPPLRWGALLRSFWVDPRRFPDFGWAWLTRFVLNLGNALATLYLLYFLTDAVRVADPEAGLVVLMVLYTAMLFAAAVVFGMWSDRSGRRKPFVVAAGVVIAVASAVLVVWQTWPAAIVAALVLGAGFGIYTSVDFALITEVLPAARDRAKDLGVINIANSMPQVLAPAMAAPVILLAGGYRTLFGLAGAISLVGGLLVQRIRAVR